MFGMSLEEQLKKRHELKMNRFELLYKTNPILFNAFVLKGPQL
jgi:hypothetical protein